MTDQTPPPDPWAPGPPAQSPAVQPQQGYDPQYGYPTQGYVAPAAMTPQGYPPPGYPPASYPPAGMPQPYQQVGPFSPLVGRNLVPNETTWSLLAHLSIFALGIIGPIIIMVTEGKKSPYTRYHAVEALNMQLTLLIVELICFATFFLILPLLLLLCAAIAAYIYGAIAAMAANRGETYRYPLIWRMVQ